MIFKRYVRSMGAIARGASLHVQRVNYNETDNRILSTQIQLHERKNGGIVRVGQKRLKPPFCIFFFSKMSFMTTEVTYIHLKCTSINLKGTQMVPEGIFVKPEVTYSNRKWNFYNWRRPLRVIQSAFEAKFGHLRSQMRLKPTFCTTTTTKMIF